LDSQRNWNEAVGITDASQGSTRGRRGGEVPRRRLTKKTPEEEWLKMKMVKVENDEDEDYDEYFEDEEKIDKDDEKDEDEVSKIIQLSEVMANLDEWKEAIKSELDSQYQKGSLRRISRKEKEELMQREDVRIIPAKGVFVIKQKKKHKCRIVACGNYEPKESYEDNYAGGADATAIRTALRRAVLEGWEISSKDVSTAFLNAEYTTKEGTLLLTPPKVVIASGFMKEGEVWKVEKAIYGLR
jgi:hypothetical protein